MEIIRNILITVIITGSRDHCVQTEENLGTILVLFIKTQGLRNQRTKLRPPVEILVNETIKLFTNSWSFTSIRSISANDKNWQGLWTVVRGSEISQFQSGLYQLD